MPELSEQFKQLERKFPQAAKNSSLSQEERYLRYQAAKLQTSELEDPIRLAAIRAALQSLKTKNQKYLQHFELNKTWRKIYNALLTANEQFELPQLVELKACEAKGKQRSFFDPFSKTPISLCYNKINRYENFEKQLLFNLILHYDNKVKPDTDWNNIESTVKSVVRGLHISGLCQKNDKKCFENEIKWRVLDKQRFEGLQINFDELYKKGVQDYEPLSQVISESL